MKACISYNVTIITGVWWMMKIRFVINLSEVKLLDSLIISWEFQAFAKCDITWITVLYTIFLWVYHRPIISLDYAEESENKFDVWKQNKLRTLEIKVTGWRSQTRLQTDTWVRLHLAAEKLSVGQTLICFTSQPDSRGHSSSI